MSAITVLAAAVAVLLLPLVITAVRHRSLAAMAARNISRRRGEAVLVVAGSLLGTAIITSSFVVGDIVDGSITDIARTQLGPVDVTVSPVNGTDLDDVAGAVEDAAVPGVAGLLTATSAVAALEAPGTSSRQARAVPSTTIVELDVAAGRALGSDPAITGLDGIGDSVATDSMVLNTRTADRLEVVPGDLVRVHAYGVTEEFVVQDVVPEVGLAGYGGAIVPPGTFGALVADAAFAAAPPRDQLLVSLAGGVFDTREISDSAVPALRDALAGLPGVEVEAVKATLLDDAEREGAMFGELFTTIGSFSVIAGLLLLVNLFVMLAEERKTELGMLRAVGFTRRRLTCAFALEGAIYASIAAVVGALVGVGIGWVVATAAGSIFGIADQGLTFRLVVDPTSLLLGGLIGLAMSLATISVTSLRIARLNIIRAIRDLAEPKAQRAGRKALVASGVGVLAGTTLSAFGYMAQSAIPLLVGVPVAAFAASPLLRRLLPERGARLVSALTTLGWGVAAFPLFGSIMGEADLPLFVAQGVVLTAGAVSLAATLDAVWVAAVDRLASRGRGLAARLGLAYPLARRFRTSMLLGMFSLVVFTMTFIAALSTAFDAQGETFTADVRGGYDVMIDSNPANPVDVAALEARSDVVAVAGLARTWVRFDNELTDEPRGWFITGIDDDLLAADVPALSSRDDVYATDMDAYEAVLADASLAIVPESFLQDGGPSSERIRLGDTFSVEDPVTQSLHELTAIGITSADWVWNGVFASRELTGSLFGAHDVAARHYVAVAAVADPDATARDLEAELLANGADAATFAGLVDEAMRQQLAFFTLLQAFLGLGLLVGVAGLAVVMVRAVRERRQEIGMLRAMGFSTRLVRAAFLSEAGLIALQGSVIGAVLGLVTARQVLTSSEAFGDGSLPFTIPWIGLAIVTMLPVLAALAASAWPASRAAATRPAVALRTAD